MSETFVFTPHGSSLTTNIARYEGHRCWTSKVASSSGKEKARGSKHRRQEDKDVASLASRAAMETAIDADDL